jgi:hydrogenase-4 component F
MVVGGVAIAGLPPFGLFISEFMILTAAFGTSRYFIAILLMVAISVVFGALLHHFQRMLAGKPVDLPARPRLLSTDFAVLGVCAAFLIVLGVHIPGAFANILQRALVVLQ